MACNHIRQEGLSCPTVNLLLFQQYCPECQSSRQCSSRGKPGRSRKHSVSFFAWLHLHLLVVHEVKKSSLLPQPSAGPHGSTNRGQMQQSCSNTCRGSLAFSNSSEAATDSSSGAGRGRGMYGLTMGEGGSAGIGRGGQSARRGGMTLFDAAPTEAEDARKAAKNNIYGTMAFSDVEKENEVPTCNVLLCCYSYKSTVLMLLL